MNVIAYGSLMNQRSLEGTLNRRAELTPVTIEGYARVFNAPFDNYAFLNLRRTDNSRIECAYFEIEPIELTKFSVREAGSELVELTSGLYAFMWPGDKAEDLPVLMSYINVCQEASRQLELDFIKGTVWPNILEDDRMKPKYRA